MYFGAAIYIILKIKFSMCEDNILCVNLLLRMNTNKYWLEGIVGCYYSCGIT